MYILTSFYFAYKLGLTHVIFEVLPTKMIFEDVITFCTRNVYEQTYACNDIFLQLSVGNVTQQEISSN